MVIRFYRNVENYWLLAWKSCNYFLFLFAFLMSCFYSSYQVVYSKDSLETALWSFDTELYTKIVTNRNLQERKIGELLP